MLFCCAVVVMASCNPYRLDSQNMLDAFETAQLVYGNGESDTLLFIPELDKVSGYFAQKRQYGKAALAALYYGYSELGFDNAAAMESLLMAEQYGVLANDSLTVARAQYQEGKMLVDDYMHEDAIVVLSNSIQCFGYHYEEKALAQNAVACCYMLLGEYDSAMVCLDRSLDYAEKGNSDLARRKTWNNYAVLYSLLGDHEQGIECLRKVSRITDTDQSPLFLMNMGKAFLACGAMDSATYYFRDLERELNNANACDETVVTAYDALSDFAERQGDYLKALEFRKQYDQYIGRVRNRIGQRNAYRIQQKYDFAVLENEIHQERMRNRLSILVIIILTLTAALLLALLVIRHKQTLREEEEMQRELDKVKRDLMKSVDADIVEEELSWRLKMMLKMKQLQEGSHSTKMKQEMMEKHIMDGGETCFDTASSAIEKVYPELASTLKAKYPSMSDTELKVCMLSIKGLTNSDIADILGISVHTVNKSRSSIYRKMGVDSDDFRDRIRGLGCNR